MLRCIKSDEEPVLMGDYNSSVGKIITVKFEMCRGDAKCKSEAEIKKWLAQKYLVVLENQLSF